MSAPRVPRRRRFLTLAELLAMIVVLLFAGAGVALAFGQCAGGRR